MTTLSNAFKSESKHNKDQLHASSHEVAREFKSFVHDVENLIKETTSLTGEDLARAKAKLSQRISSAKDTISDASGNIAAQARHSAKVADNYVHEKPWVAIGAGAALSFAIGFFLANRESR